jgi:chromatin segregation and condensation protein Rec8/ScpA/Scc1 (kleisin family)
VLQEDEIYDESDRHNDENNADRKDALSDGMGDNLSDGLGNNLSEPEPTMQSEIAAMRMMMEEQRENQLHTVNRDELKYRQIH